MDEAAADSDHAFEQIFALTQSSDEASTEEPAYQHHLMQLPTQNSNNCQTPKHRLPHKSSVILCEKHTGKVIEYYCNKCDELCCMTCILQHCGCQAAVIEDEISKTETYKNISTLLQRMESTVKQSTKLREDAAHKEITDQKGRQELKRQVTAFREEINEQLDEWQNQLYLQIDVIHDEAMAKAISTGDASELITTETVKLKENLKRLASREQNFKLLFILSKKSERRIVELEVELAELQKNMDIQECEFIPNRKTIPQLKAENSLGKLNTKNTKKQNCLQEWCQSLVSVKMSLLGVSPKKQSSTNTSPNRSPRISPTNLPL